MTGKKPPVRAIAEARKWAGEQGFAVYLPEPGETYPFHFIVSERGTISLVTVRSPRYLDFNIVNVSYSCRTVIRELRALTGSPDIKREIWVKRKADTWYRYLVGPENIEYIDPGKKDGPDGGGTSPSSPRSADVRGTPVKRWSACRKKEKCPLTVLHLPCEEPVDLLRHRTVERAQAGFDMR